MKRFFKRIAALSLVGVMAFGLAGCGDNGNPSGSSDIISVVTREDASGTRGAFVELVDITIDGNDNIYVEAIVAPGTSVMMTNIAENPLAIGYVSSGVAQNDARVQMLSINGVAPTVENILNGTYVIARPFLIAYNTAEGLSDLAQDFVNFIFSAQGQAVISGRNYVPVIPTGAPQYTGGGLSGELVVNGSSSLYSLMGHLVYAYNQLNPDVDIDVHGAGTGQGIAAVRDGLADIALSSRDLRETELAILTPMTIAYDGIAVIVHPNNTVTNLTIEQVRNIFQGDANRWDDFR
ncbi:MAG: substrate-binding domain-containing protein [Defluviitaleaceae bacterium]|nr:substrate-binding domain-containing protein [Defluviitaleaceae bacterium]